jgi:hypothetical protein
LVVGGALALWSIDLVGFGGLQAIARILSSEFWPQSNGANWWKMQSLPALLQLGTSGLVTTALTIGSVLAGQLLLWRSRVVAHAADPDPRQAFAQAILVTALVSPHFFIYDCVILLIPALLLLDQEPESRTFRLGPLAAWLVTWTSALRFLAFGALPFPLWLLAGPLLPPIIAILQWQSIRSTGRHLGPLAARRQATPNNGHRQHAHQWT